MTESILSSLPACLQVEFITTTRARIANVERCLATYRAEAAGTRPTHKLPATIADDIARCEHRLAHLRASIA